MQEHNQIHNHYSLGDIFNFVVKNKKILIVVSATVLLFAVLISWYIVWNISIKNSSSTSQDQSNVNQAIKGALPSISTNPLEDKPNLNPAEQSNPIRKVKTNPFE